MSPVDGEVPGQCVRPFVAEHLDGLRLTKIAVELDHEPLIPPKALAQEVFGKPGSPNNDGKGCKAQPLTSQKRPRCILTPAAIFSCNPSTHPRPTRRPIAA